MGERAKKKGGCSGCSSGCLTVFFLLFLLGVLFSFTRAGKQVLMIAQFVLFPTIPEQLAGKTVDEAEVERRLTAFGFDRIPEGFSPVRAEWVLGFGTVVLTAPKVDPDSVLKKGADGNLMIEPGNTRLLVVTHVEGPKGGANGPGAHPIQVGERSFDAEPGSFERGGVTVFHEVGIIEGKTVIAAYAPSKALASADFARFLEVNGFGLAPGHVYRLRTPYGTTVLARLNEISREKATVSIYANEVADGGPAVEPRALEFEGGGRRGLTITLSKDDLLSFDPVHEYAAPSTPAPPPESLGTGEYARTKGTTRPIHSRSDHPTHGCFVKNLLPTWITKRNELEPCGALPRTLRSWEALEDVVGHRTVHFAPFRKGDPEVEVILTLEGTLVESALEKTGWSASALEARLREVIGSVLRSQLSRYGTKTLQDTKSEARRVVDRRTTSLVLSGVPLIRSLDVRILPTSAVVSHSSRSEEPDSFVVHELLGKLEQELHSDARPGLKARIFEADWGPEEIQVYGEASTRSEVEELASALRAAPYLTKVDVKLVRDREDGRQDFLIAIFLKLSKPEFSDPFDSGRPPLLFRGGLGQHGRWFSVGSSDVNAPCLGDVTDEKLRELEHPVYLRITRASFKGCRGVTDAGLEHIMKLRRLTRLNLEGTSVTEQGLRKLASLPELKELSALPVKTPDTLILEFAERRMARP